MDQMHINLSLVIGCQFYNICVALSGILCASLLLRNYSMTCNWILRTVWYMFTNIPACYVYCC